MNRKTKIIAATGLCLFFFTFAAQAQYYPLKLVNYTSKTTSGVHPYVIFMAQDMTPAANYCVLQLTYNANSKAQVGKLVQINKTTNAMDYSYRLDSLQGYDTATHSVNVLIPNCISGRCMVSLNYRLYMPPVLSGNNINWVLQDPSVSNTGDVNYNIIYDKFEFTYNGNNIMYIDPTAVDFFSIPIGLKSKKESSGPPPTTKRDSLVNIVVNTLSDSSTNTKWDSLVIKDKASGSILRITAPYMAPQFDSSYLKSTTGFNYIDSLTKYYTTHTLKINCSELNDTGMEVFDKYRVSPKQDPGAYLFTSDFIKNGLWIFKNSPKKGTLIYDTIDMNYARSFNFFGPGTYPFLTTNKMVISIIVKNITAAFTVGLLPAPDKMTIDPAYISNTAKYPYYVHNKQLKAPAGTGPWYNLYTQSLHMAIPQIYAFAFDDVLGQSGTLVSGNNKDTISVIFGDMGSIVIPYHSDSLPVNAPKLTYNSGFVHIGHYYVDTLRWTVPIDQPSTANYFFMGSGPDFTIPPQNFLNFQYGKFYPSADTMGWVSVPDSLFTTCMSTDIPMAVYACGGVGMPCPTATNWTIWTTAPGSNLLPLQGGVVYPDSVTYNSGFTKSGNNYVATVSWSVPPNQPANAQYFFMGAGPGFTIPPDTFINYQPLDSLYGGQDTTGTITIPTSVFGNSLTKSISIQVFTCGGPGHPCPTKQNLNAWSCGIGSKNILAPAAKKEKKSKKKK